MNDDPLKTSVQFLRGVGPERARLLANLGIVTVEDLLWNLPRDVLDLTNVCPAAATSRRASCKPSAERSSILTVARRETAATWSPCFWRATDFTSAGVWFNQPWMIHKFHGGEIGPVFGQTEAQRGPLGIRKSARAMDRAMRTRSANVNGGILPRYGLTEGLSMDQMGRIARAAVEGVRRLDSRSDAGRLYASGSNCPFCERPCGVCTRPKRWTNSKRPGGG